MDLVSLLPLFLLSFASGVIDLSLGMGYGFTVTPVMLLLGYPAEVAVPVVLFTSFAGGVASSFFNHRFKNVDFTAGSRASKVAIFAGAFGILGSIAGAGLSFSLPAKTVGLYIGLIVILSGVLAVYSLKLSTSFGWGKMLGITLFGSLNKGLTGSGFGPILTTGAMLSGIDEKSSVSIQALSEASISIVGFATYLYLGRGINLPVLAAMTAGVLLASPVAAHLMKRLTGKTLRILVGVLAVVIGASTILSNL
jgi:uncharacterized membrane protein YfcA